jgi:hypothetical protein
VPRDADLTGPGQGGCESAAFKTGKTRHATCELPHYTGGCHDTNAVVSRGPGGIAAASVR